MYVSQAKPITLVLSDVWRRFSRHTERRREAAVEMLRNFVVVIGLRSHVYYDISYGKTQSATKIRSNILSVQFDLPTLLRAIVRADSPASVAAALTARTSSRSVVLVRVWLSDETLTLVSSAGTPSGGGSYTRLDGEFREMAVADRTIQQIAASREPFVVRGLRGDEEWLTNHAWAARQGVRAFLAFPMVADDRVIGLLAAFDRDMPDTDLVAQLALAVDIAGHRVAELRARPAVAVPPPSSQLTSVPVSDLRSEEGRRSSGGTALLTREELRRIEKANIEAALVQTQGKVFGADGAAALLGMRPTTLASRIKALKIARA